MQDQLLKYISLMQEIENLLIASEKPEIIASKIVKHIPDLITTARAIIYLYEGENNNYEAISTKRLNKQTEELLFRHSMHILNCHPNHAEGLSFTFPGLYNMASVNNIENGINNLNIKSAMGIQLKNEDVTYGLLLVISPKENLFIQETKLLIETLALMLIVSFLQHNSSDKRPLNGLQTNPLPKVLATMDYLTDPAQILDHILQQLANVVPYDSASFILREKDNSLWIVAGRGLPAHFNEYGKKIVFRSPLIDQIQKEKKAIILEDAQSDERFDPSNGVDYIRSWMGIPLIVRGQVIGVLTIDNRNPAEYEENDASTALAFASQAATVIDKAYYFESLEKRVKDRTRVLMTLYQLAAIASEVMDIDTILEKSLELTLETMNRDWGGIHLYEEDKKVFRLAVYRGIPVPMLTKLETIPVDCGLSGLVYKHRMPIYSHNILTDPRSILFNEKGIEARTFLSAPMIARERFLGTLGIYGEVGQPYDTEDRELLKTISDQIAIATENAQLREKAQMTAVMEERQRLARDMHDSVTQSIYSLALNTDTCIKLLNESKFERLAAILEDTKENALQALKEMRLLLHELRPEVLENEGLVEAIKHRLDAVEQRAGINVDITSNGEINLPKQLEVELYQVTVEALNNALRHSSAKKICVTIHKENDAIELEILDDGKGADLAHVLEGGMGLKNMKKRIKDIGGKIEIDTAPGKGMRVNCIVNLKDKRWIKK